jgi:glycosyltransferase involved in cell wall biosynthesis
VRNGLNDWRKMMSKELKLKKISVVIPMYNSENTIIATLDSIKAQTDFKDILEVLVVNDGSIDNSLDLVKKYSIINGDMPITIIDKPNGGVSSARNVGMKMARGDFIALLDADDVWLPEKISLQMDILKANSSIDFLGCNTNEKSLWILFKRIDKLYKANIKDICIKSFPQTSGAIFKRSIINEIGYFDEKQSHGEDMNYFNKICSKFNYFQLPVYLVCYGGGKRPFGDKGLSANLKKMHEGYIKNIKELREDLIISSEFYMFLRIFYWMKYIRRIIITKIKQCNG